MLNNQTIQVRAKSLLMRSSGKGSSCERTALRRCNRRKCSQIQQGRSGLTLLEIVAALLLSSLLLTGLHRVMEGFAKQSIAVSHLPEQESWLRRLRSRLEWDLKNSRQIRIGADKFSLVGFASRDDSGHPTHAPTTVSYSIHNGVLIRSSLTEDVQTKTIQQRREYMSNEITKILIGREEDTVNDLLIPVPEQNRLHVLSDVQKVYILAESQVIAEFLVFR